MSARISVVIPTYRRDDLLQRCLTALAAQTLPASEGSPTADSEGDIGVARSGGSRTIGPYEIIVCDDANSPDTNALVLRFSSSAPGLVVRYVAVRGSHGPAAARNAGWRSARGEIIAFTDDDCIPSPTWLHAGSVAFADQYTVAAVWGKVRMPIPDRPTDYQRDAAGLASAEFVTSNCFCRREALEAVGGFDERFGMAWREDSDLYFSLRERGYPVIHCPAAVVVHPIRPAGWGISLRQQRKTQYDALLFKKHPALYRDSIPPYPRDYYSIVAFALLAMIAAAASAPIESAIAAFAAMAVTGRFCARRLQGTSHSPGHVTEMIATSLLIPPVSLYWRLRGSIRYRVLFFY